jgi:hypothetical protein
MVFGHFLFSFSAAAQYLTQAIVRQQFAYKVREMFTDMQYSLE